MKYHYTEVIIYLRRFFLSSQHIFSFVERKKTRDGKGAVQGNVGIIYTKKIHVTEITETKE